MTLKKALQQIRPVSSETKKAARLRWDQVAKPLNSLGILEEDLVRIVGAQNSEAVCLDQKWIAVMCADNGNSRSSGKYGKRGLLRLFDGCESRGKGTSCGCGNCLRYGRDGDFKPENTLWNPEFPERACHDAGGNGKSHGNRDGSGRDSKRKGLSAGRLR